MWSVFGSQVARYVATGSGRRWSEAFRIFWPLSVLITTWRSADSGGEVRNAAPANLMQLIWYIGWTSVYSANLFVTNIMHITPFSKNHLKPAFKLYLLFCSSRTFSNAIFFKTQMKNTLRKLNYAQSLDWIVTVNTVMSQEKSGDFFFGILRALSIYPFSRDFSDHRIDHSSDIPVNTCKRPYQAKHSRLKSAWIGKSRSNLDL